MAETVHRKENEGGQTGAMPTTPERPRGRPPSTSRAAVIEAALALAEQEGFASLNVRAVAARLGVSHMTLYGHVRDKQELLEQVVDAVLAQVELPAAAADPLGDLEELGHRLRATLLRFPGAAAHALDGGLVWPAAGRISEWSLDALRRAGYAPAAAAGAYVAFVHHVVGHAHIETRDATTTPGAPASEHHARLTERLGQLDAAQLPRLAESAAALAALDGSASFARGLSLLVGGMRRELAEPRT
jgi:AcrR family transcriptional regulator